MPMQTRYDLNALFLLVLLGAATAADAQVQPQLAQRYFEEATKLCERDAGRLWGVSLCGPMVIVDQATGTRATSQPEPEGPPPRFPGFADGPVSWGGLRWFSFPLYMLPEKDADVRQQMMLHGLFHRIQPELGFMTRRRLQRASRYARRARLDAARMAGAPPGGRVERERAGRGDRRCAGLQARTPPPVSRRGGQRTARRDSGRACLLHRHRGLGQFARGCPPCRSVSSSQEANRSRPSSEISKLRVRTRLRCAAGRSPAGMAPTGSWHLGPWRLARLRNQQATDDGCCRGSGALRWGNAANGGGGARSGAAGPRRRVASTLR